MLIASTLKSSNEENVSMNNQLQQIQNQLIAAQQNLKYNTIPNTNNVTDLREDKYATDDSKSNYHSQPSSSASPFESIQEKLLQIKKSQSKEVYNDTLRRLMANISSEISTSPPTATNNTSSTHNNMTNISPPESAKYSHVSTNHQNDAIFQDGTEAVVIKAQCQPLIVSTTKLTATSAINSAESSSDSNDKLDLSLDD